MAGEAERFLWCSWWWEFDSRFGGFADQPLQSRVLSERQGSAVIADPILIINRVPDGIGLFGELLDGVARLGELIQALLHGLPAAIHCRLRIHRREGLALDGQPEKGLSFDIDNCSITRLDLFASPDRTVWRLPMVNQQPWIADAAHAAMHQPAGPEVTPPGKLA